MEGLDEIRLVPAMLFSSENIEDACRYFSPEEKNQYLKALFARSFSTPMTWDQLQLAAEYYGALEPNDRNYVLGAIDDDSLFVLCILEKNAEHRYIAFKSMAQLLPETRFSDLLDYLNNSQDKTCIYRLFFSRDAENALFVSRLREMITVLNTTHISLLIQYFLNFTPKNESIFFDFLAQRIRYLCQYDALFATKGISITLEFIQLIQTDLKHRFIDAAQETPEKCLDFFKSIPRGAQVIKAIEDDFLKTLCFIVRDASYTEPVLLQTLVTATMSLREHIKLALPSITYTIGGNDKTLKRDILCCVADSTTDLSAVNVAYCLTEALDAEAALLLTDAEERYCLLYQWLQEYRNQDDMDQDCCDLEVLRSKLSTLHQFTVDDIATLVSLHLSDDVKADISTLKAYLQIRYAIANSDDDPIRAAPIISFYFKPSILAHLSQKEMVIVSVCLLENRRLERYPMHTIKEIIDFIGPIYHPHILGQIRSDIIKNHVALMRRKFSDYPELRAAYWKKLSTDEQTEIVLHVLVKTAGPFGKKLATMIQTLRQHCEAQEKSAYVKHKIGCMVSAVNGFTWRGDLEHQLAIQSLLETNSALYAAIRIDTRVDIDILQDIQNHKLSMPAVPIVPDIVQQERSGTPTAFR